MDAALYGAQVLRSAFGRLHLPGATILRWLDSHVQLRLSILLTYLFGKSLYFAQLMRWAGGMLRYLRIVAQPALMLLGMLQEVQFVPRCTCVSMAASRTSNYASE